LDAGELTSQAAAGRDTRANIFGQQKWQTIMSAIVSRLLLQRCCHDREPSAFWTPHCA